MWNDARAQIGKGPLGFINPVLYDLASNTADTFTDVVIGDNHCGGEGDQCCSAAYLATIGSLAPVPRLLHPTLSASTVTGWDAVTGLGSPSWAAVARAVRELP